MADSVDDMVNEISDAGENEAARSDTQADIREKRDILKMAAATGDLDRSLKYVERLTAKGVESMYLEWEKLKHLQRQTFLCDLFLNRFSQVLGYLRIVKDTESLKTDLKEDQLLANDISRVISYVEPYVPFVGLLSGSLTVASHALSGREKEEEKEEKEEEKE